MKKLIYLPIHFTVYNMDVLIWFKIYVDENQNQRIGGEYKQGYKGQSKKN